MTDRDDPAKPSARRRLAAYAVHLFTATGAVLGLLALLAAVEGDWVVMFVWLGLSLIVDGVDGMFARRVDVVRVLPRYDGTALDLVVDFVTYVFVPSYALAVSGLVPEGLGVVAASVVCVTSAFYFADTRQKTADYYFQGFPAVWSLVVFLLFLYRLPPGLAFLAVLAISALTFVPLDFVHPVRVAKARLLTLGVTLACAVLAAVALGSGLAPPASVTVALTICVAYLIGIGLLRTAAGRRDAQE